MEISFAGSLAGPRGLRLRMGERDGRKEGGEKVIGKRLKKKKKKVECTSDKWQRRTTRGRDGSELRV